MEHSEPAKKLLAILAVAICSAQIGYCSDPALESLKALADTESVSPAPGGEYKSGLGLFSPAPADNEIAQSGLAMPYFLMAPRPAYTSQAAGINGGYPVLASHAVIPDKESLLKAVSFWNAFLEKAGVKLYSMDAAAVRSGYTLEILYIGDPVIKSFDGCSAGLVYSDPEAAAIGAVETAARIETAGGKVLAKFTVRQGDKFSFAVYFRSGAASGENAAKAVDLFSVEAEIGAIVQGAHQVVAYASGAAAHFSNTESYKADYKGKYNSGKKAVKALISAAERRTNVKGLQIYSNEGPEGRVYSCLVFWKGLGF